MKPSRSKKRRRLVQSYVSSQWPDAPVTFESLNDDTLTTVLEFVGRRSYRSFGGLNKQCKEVYLNTKGMTKETFLYGYAPLSVITDKIERSDDDDIAFVLFNPDLKEAVCKGVVFYNRMDVLAWALEERKKYVLRGICDYATGEGRLDILKEVFNNIDDEGDKKYVFGGVDTHAARGGKLDVLKWFETKGSLIDKEWCANQAAGGGHKCILRWLREEKGLELDGELYMYAIYGDQLHVMKWLREQEVDWDKRTFPHAAYKGNLNILQWLRDEGCPWPRSVQIDDEEDVTPEVIDWYRSNGYGDRLI